MPQPLHLRAPPKQSVAGVTGGHCIQHATAPLLELQPSDVTFLNLGRSESGLAGSLAQTLLTEPARLLPT